MHLHRSNRAEILVDTLAQILAEPLADPFAAECIVVQGAGMQRYLSLELAARLGVFAHGHFPFPRRFLQEAFETVLGEADDVGEAWEPESLVWAIAHLLPECLGDPRFEPIRHYLADEQGDDRTLALSRRLAETFDHYAVYRPEMVLAWERGDDAATKLWSGVDHPWQPALWRVLVEHQGDGHLARRVGRLIDALRGEPERAARLPRRVSMFGISGLPPLFVSAFGALAGHAAFHAFVLSPSGEYWGAIRSEREVARLERTGPGADGADLHLDVGHPLLASLGRLGRDFQEVLEERVDYSDDDVDLHVDPAREGRTTMLAQLQSDMLSLRDRGGPGGALPPAILAEYDRSIAVHACHGPMREAEVLRDQLLDLFERDPTLEPHDVVIMTPDVAAYAPAVQAALAGGAGLPPIPCRVADRMAVGAFEVVEAFERALDLLSGRVTASDGLDFLSFECVRRRFGIDSDEEALLRSWVETSGIRWGLDAEHRAREGQPAAVENTWRFGIDRLLVGLAMEDGPGRLFFGVRPEPGVEGLDAQAVGKLAAWLEALVDLEARLRAPRSPTGWARVLGEVLDRLIAVDAETAHQRQFVLDALQGLASGAARGGFRTPLALPAIREMLQQQMGRAVASGGFLTGAVTLCELTPMRSIPFRVVCLMGMNDGAFPRMRRRPAFDLIGARRRIGDRSARDDDRHLFLEALLSARDHLVVTYVGRDIRDNEPRPPSGVVGELLDHLSRAFAPDASDPSRASYEEDARGWLEERLVIEHPLKPWSDAYFAEPGDPRLFSYATDWGEAAGLRARLNPGVLPFLREPLDPPEGETPLELGTLTDYFQNPSRGLLVRRLGVRLQVAEATEPDREPLGLDPLDGFALGEELLLRAVEGEDPSAGLDRVAGAGILPLGVHGTCTLDEVVEEVRGLAQRVEAARGEARPDVDVSLVVGDVELVGRLDGLSSSGRVVHRYAKLGQRSELSAWIAHLVLCAVQPEGVLPVSHLVGRPGDDGHRHVRFEPVADALEQLAQLVHGYRVGMTRALPFFPRSSRKYVEVLKGDPTRDDQASLDAYNLFGDTWRTRPEGADPYVRQLFGDVDPIASSFRPVGETDDALGFRRLALAVFSPLLAHRSPVS